MIFLNCNFKEEPIVIVSTVDGIQLDAYLSFLFGNIAIL